ncbi:Predicted coiled-coil protein [Plasmopara halstedii]|uniref:Predicted coiled-coil protein n=1 Tax=Plasmopara halstedii TaxID=4781 RepID=A0A0P1B256_PLAHL|nr:Predicted coiled-coil protein [Plasmopara halstedii]CEG48074.1 Predicted coiled-coil protein [Plasmopara halstedii]|eukprot:XP_024584443.1 Predicted coiled-coil protein [Plasmopara halstedii]
MSFRELRNLTEMMRSLGYPRPISMENFRLPNFELVSDLLYWMVKKYEPSANVSEEIDTEDDRVEFLTQVTVEVLAKAHIRLNPKKLYAADGFAVKELLKLAQVLYEASRIDFNTAQEVDDDEDESSMKSLLGSRIKDPKATRQLGSDLTQAGAKLYDLLETELDVREVRQQALRFLDALATTSEHSKEQKYLERSIQEILVTLQDNVERTERQVVELDAEEKALATKIQKAHTDLERSEKRLKSLQHVRPAFMDEYEKLEMELERQYAIYCERFRNLDYLQRELELHKSRELKQLVENDRSLKKLHKKFRDDELAILRGEQDEQMENSIVEKMDKNRRHGDERNGTNQREESDLNDSDEESLDEPSGSSEEENSSDESLEHRDNVPSGSDSDQVSLADSGELIDQDEDSESRSEVSGSGVSGSDTNSDSSDQDF